jgi:hypothetical protein
MKERNKFQPTITKKDGTKMEVSPPSVDHKVDKRIPILTWSKVRPQRRPPIAKLGGVQLITPKNVCSIIGRPSFGKSTICEAILSKIENPDCDGLGWEFSEEVKNVIWFDCERTIEDVEDSMSRIMQRAEIDNDPKRIEIIPLKSIPRGRERRDLIEKAIEKMKPSIVIIDGAGDLVTDTNSLEQATHVTDFFRRMTEVHDVAILTTLHPNFKGMSEGSPRGHIGSELMRESQAVLTIKKNSDDTRTLTTKFDSGKCKFGDAESHFKWDGDNGMVVSSGEPSNASNKKGDPQAILSNEQIDSLLFEAMGDVAIGYTELINKLKYYLERDYKERVNSGQNKLFNFKTWLEDGNFIKPIKGERYTKYRFNPDRVKQLTILDE